ncbi:MAG: PAS domain S-box protein, partial [Haloarculaceae archaeon]
RGGGRARMSRARNTETDLWVSEDAREEWPEPDASIEAMLDAISDIFYVIDWRGRFRTWNDQLPERLGYAPEEIGQLDPLGVIAEADRERAVRTLARVAAGTEQSADLRLTTADGEAVPFECTAAPLVDDDGDVWGLVGTARDVSDRRSRAELLERLHTGVRELMAAETVAEVAETAARVAQEHFGFPSVAVRRATADGVLVPVAHRTDTPCLEADLPTVPVDEGWVGQVYAAGEPVSTPDVEALAVDRDFGAAESLLGVPIEGFGIVSIAATERDAFDAADLELARLFAADLQAAFERANREERLRERQRELERYETMIETMGDAVYWIDEDGYYREFNDGLVELMGYERAEMLGSHFREFASEAFLETAREMNRTLRTGERDQYIFEVEYELPDGSVVPMETNIRELVEDGEYQGLVGVSRDLTERRERQGELERYETIVDTMGDPVYWIDEDGVYRECNDELADLMGCTREDIIGSHISELTSEQFLEHAREMNRVLLEGDADHGIFEFEYDRADGETVPVELHLQVLTVDDEYRGVVGVSRDLTERKERERELERYETLVETMSDGAYMTDADHRITEVNDALVDLTGRDRDDLVGMDIHDLARGDAYARASAHRAALLSGDKDFASMEGRLETADGELIPFENRYSLLPSDDGFRGTVGVIRDVTERREREETLTTQRDELETLNRINELVQETIGSLTSAATREEIEDTVCRRLADSPLYRFAMTGRPSPVDDSLNAQLWAGDGAAYLEEVTIPTDPDAPDAGPVANAIATGEVTVTSDVTADPSFEPFREAALEHGFRSLAVVPFTSGSVVHGTLSVYADRPGAFSEREIHAFQVLGEMVGFAISATQNRRLIESGTGVELTFQLVDVDLFFTTVTERLAANCRLLGTARAADGRMLHYVAVEGADPEAVLSLREEYSGDAPDVQLVREGEDDEAVFEVRIEESIVSLLLESGVSPTELSADGELVRLAVEAPRDVDIRTLTERLEANYGDVSMVSKREVEGLGTTSTDVREHLHEALTDRQRAALHATYFAGYFEWPRENNAEEVAESLGISSATLHQHLRHAQQKLLAAYLTDEAGSPVDLGI